MLHVDKNPYYGGAEAAFSLQEAQEWVDRLRQGQNFSMADGPHARRVVAVSNHADGS